MKKLYLLLLPFLISSSGLNVASPNKASVKPAADTSDDYYASISSDASSYQLLAQIRDLTVSKHTKFITWDDLGKNEMYMQTDYDPENKETNFIDFYTRESTDHEWGNGRIYNREHVWCASRSNLVWERDKEKTEDGKDHSMEGGGCDIHHIRPTYADVNSGRSNDIFTEYPVDQRIERKTGTRKRVYGWTIPNANDAYFEPKDEVKGDIARILMYVFVHYSKPEDMGKNLPVPTEQVIGDPSLVLYNKGKLIRTGSLKLNDIIVKSENDPDDVVGSWQTLLKWHKNDPVDQYEINRNEGAYLIQGNRNPFIDHPEYAEKAFVFEASETVDPPTPPKENDTLDEKTIIIIAVSTAVVAVTIITVVILIYHGKKKRL